jgi:hypothetical protein
MNSFNVGIAELDSAMIRWLLSGRVLVDIIVSIREVSSWTRRSSPVADPGGGNWRRDACHISRVVFLQPRFQCASEQKQ